MRSVMAQSDLLEYPDAVNQLKVTKNQRLHV